MWSSLKFTQYLYSAFYKHIINMKLFLINEACTDPTNNECKNSQNSGKGNVPRIPLDTSVPIPESIYKLQSQEIKSSRHLPKLSFNQKALIRWVQSKHCRVDRHPLTFVFLFWWCNTWEICLITCQHNAQEQRVYSWVMLWGISPMYCIIKTRRQKAEDDDPSNGVKSVDPQVLCWSRTALCLDTI